MSSIKTERVKQLLSNGKILVKIEKHQARRTIARTLWGVPSDAILIHSTVNPLKTHWYEYYVCNANSVWTRVRISNRGNWSITKMKADQLRISDKEQEELLILLENQ